MPKQLNVRSDEAYAAATRLAQRLGTTTTEAVLRALRRLEQETYRPVRREEFTPEEESTYKHFKELAQKARQEATPPAPETPAPAAPAAPLHRLTMPRAAAPLASPSTDAMSSEERITRALGGKK